MDLVSTGGGNHSMSGRTERVVFHEARGNETGPMRFVRVDIRYTDGDPFYGASLIRVVFRSVVVAGLATL